MDHNTIPWCYTMDPKVRWAYCDIPKCKTERKCARPPILCGATPFKTELIGQKVRVTYRCYTDFKCMGGRNVSTCDMETGVWEWPDLLCGSENCFYFDRDQWRAAVYLGNISTTLSGRTCQSWDSQTPHKHDKTATRNTGAGSLSELGNKCRVLNHGRVPWCFTADPDKEWKYCPVPECTCNRDSVILDVLKCC